MNWQEIASSISQAFRNAGVKKDVIDLQEKQLGLLTHEIDVLTHKLEVSETKRANLESKLADLELELERLRPKQGRLKQGAEQILKLLFNRDDDSVSVEDMATTFGIQRGVAQHHCDVLYESEMIGFTSLREYYLLPKRRAYVAMHILKR